MLIREKIKRKIECYLEAQKLDLSPVWQVELPKERSVADYATNLAFIAVKHMKKSPQEIAQEMAVGILDYFSEPEWKGMQITALRGFINFTLSPSFCYDALRQDAFATQLVEPHAKILLEYVSANPTGPLHIGHGRWAALGDSLWRMMKRVGYQVD
ncbi:MAG: arginine--tRNA ligase, partial [Candidatus Margulisiibacteriota bacterium]